MVVKIDARLISSFCLLCLIANVAPSNPDSEIVQDEQVKSTVKKRASGFASADNPLDLALVPDRYSAVKVLLNVYSNAGGGFWKEIATLSGGELIRVRDRGDVVEVSRTNDNNQSLFLKTITIDSQSGNRQNNYRPGNNPGGTYGGNVPNENVPGGANSNVRNGNVPNENLANGHGLNRNDQSGYVYGGANGNGANRNGQGGSFPSRNVISGHGLIRNTQSGYGSYGSGSNGNVPDRNGPTNGNVPNRDGLNGNVPDRNEPNGNFPNGNVPNREGLNGNVPYRNGPNGNFPNGNVPNREGLNGNVPHRNGPNGNFPNDNVRNGNGQSGYGLSISSTRNSYEPNGNVPNGNRPNGNEPDGRVTGDTRPRPFQGNRGTPPPKNNQNNSGPKRISPDANLFATIVNNFAFKMVEKMRIGSNFVVSPLSIFTALSMSYLGAAGRTEFQLARILGLDDYGVHGTSLHRGISDLLSMISPESDEYKLFVANALFFGLNFTVEESFKENVKQYYGAELKNLDFSDQLGSLNAINGWVANKSRNTIPNLINSPLDVNTKLVLLTAMFFKGKWKTPFPQQNTYNKVFFAAGGSEKTVPFMTMYRGTFPHYRSEEHRHTFIKLPYLGDHMSMIIALPFGLDQAPMPTITNQILCHTIDAMRDKNFTSISVPRFKLEYLKSLARPLADMGLRDLFEPSVDMTKMRKENDVFVSDILHKAGIEVHEKGTTASAATEVQYMGLSGGGDFHANHPFAFYIVHDDSGLVLFHGKIMDIDESST